MGTNFAIESDRVRRNTNDNVNEKIDQATRLSVRRYTGASRSEIEARLRELDEEWDIERVLEVNASALALTGVIFGATVNRRWWLLSGTVLGFLFLHGVQGWCPPLPVLRRLGVRTCGEIDQERFALMNLLGNPEPPPPTRRRLGALVSSV
jgi:hypothetical protein